MIVYNGYADVLHNMDDHDHLHIIIGTAAIDNVGFMFIYLRPLYYYIIYV